MNGEKISETETVYKIPARDFELGRITLANNKKYVSPDVHGPDIMILLDGKVTAKCDMNSMNCIRGDALFVPANLKYTLSTDNTTTIYKATVPMNN